jgi:hypothetical protein
VEEEQQMLQEEVEQVDFVLLHHFQFLEQQDIQLQLEQEEQVDLDLLVVDHKEILQIFQQ